MKQHTDIPLLRGKNIDIDLRVQEREGGQHAVAYYFNFWWHSSSSICSTSFGNLRLIDSLPARDFQEAVQDILKEIQEELSTFYPGSCHLAMEDMKSLQIPQLIPHIPQPAPVYEKGQQLSIF